MKLSIITVNLNNVEGLRKTAESIVTQTFQDFEWIVIDGGSTDGSKELVEQYLDHIAYWCSEKDSGIYNAMNKGVSHANGEYVQFLNSGDYLFESSTLDEVFKLTCPGVILFGDTLLVNSKGEKEMIKFEELSFFHLLTGSLCHQAMFIPRELLMKFPYNEKYKIVSDWEFCIKMALINHKFKHVDLIICEYNSEGISAQRFDLKNEERRQVINQYIPESILYDLSKGQSFRLLELRKSYPFYSKMITGSVLIMNKVIVPFMESLKKIFHLEQ